MIDLFDTADLAEGEARGLEQHNQYLFVVRKNGNLYLYWNRCPHLGTPLEWEEHRFLDADGALIQCSNHGALFQIDDGRCLVGPCKGKYLQAVPFSMSGSVIQVAEELFNRS